MRNYLKIALVFSCLIIVSSAHAQYQSIFGANQTVWKTSNCGALSAPCFFDSTYTTGNDTVFNGITFKGIRTNPTGSSGLYLGEDTATGSVWFRSWNPVGITYEQVMDMTLMVNDSFDFGNQVGKHRVDSVYVKNNRKIIRFDETFTFYAPGTTLGVDTLKMIEGVGTNLGVVPYLFYSIGNYLLCQEKDSVRAFETNNHPAFDCSSKNPISSLQETSIGIQITIQPNPASNIVSLNGEGQTTIEEVEFIDVKGSVVKRIQNPQKEIVISDLENGLYFIKIHSNQGIVSKQLVISK